MQYNRKHQLHLKHNKIATKTATTTLTIATIFAIVMSLSLLFQIGTIASAHALSHYFNCIIRGANKSGTLTLTNVETCYDKVFKGASSNSNANQASNDGNNDNVN
jgi:2-phospho-L-lactate guanylyltransferase (CobY/MobA/RfbA family)